MEQSAIPLDILSLALMMEPLYTHKLICKSVYQYIKLRHPLRQWFRKVIREAISDNEFRVSYSITVNPFTYSIWNIEGSKAELLVNDIRLKAQFDKEYQVKENMYNVPLATINTYNRNQHWLNLSFNGFVFTFWMSPGHQLGQEAQFLIGLKDSVEWLLSLFDNILGH